MELASKPSSQSMHPSQGSKYTPAKDTLESLHLESVFLQVYEWELLNDCNSISY